MNRNERRTVELGHHVHNGVYRRAGKIRQTTQSTRLVLAFLRWAGISQSESLNYLVQQMGLSFGDAEVELVTSEVWETTFWQNLDLHNALDQAAQQAGFKLPTAAIQ